MKKYFVIFACVFLIACGGSGSDSNPSVSANESLPDIIDDQADGLFMYSDPSLYEHLYTKNTASDSCTFFFGQDMPLSVQITSMSGDSITFRYDGSDEQVIPGKHQDDRLWDSYYYGEITFLFIGVCGFFVGSANDGDTTVDLAQMACIDPVTPGSSCVVSYVRHANYDFTTQTIR